MRKEEIAKKKKERERDGYEIVLWNVHLQENSEELGRHPSKNSNVGLSQGSHQKLITLHCA